VRSLTRSEAEVVGLLLARDERPLRRVPGVAYPHRRTIQEIRQRAYERGWLVDRLIPAPLAFGLDRMLFAFAHAPSDQINAQLDRWRRRPECTLLWRRATELFGVFWTRAPESAGLGRELLDPAGGSHSELLEAESRSISVPVYFDYEMAWARVAGLSGVSAACPRPVPEPVPTGDRGPVGTLPTFQQDRVRDLVRGFATSGAEGSLGDRFRRARFEGHARQRGWTSFRTLLRPVALGDTVSGFPDWVAFVRGRLRPGAGASDLFRAVVLSARVSPFLFASSDEQVLLVTMAYPPGSRSAAPRTPVLPTVQEYLADVSVTNWSLRETQVLTDHDYVGAISLARGS
jgi:hypothetical protein